MLILDSQLYIYQLIIVSQVPQGGQLEVLGRFSLSGDLAPSLIMLAEIKGEGS